MDKLRRRALVPKTSEQPDKAASRESWIVAVCSRSSAPEAMAVASALGNILGVTRWSELRPMTFMALAVAPMLPGWVVLIKTTRILDNRAATRASLLVSCAAFIFIEN